MDRLEAINTILDEIGTNHVTTPDARHPDAKSAALQLNLEKKALLLRGWWFNTLLNVTVPLQANGALLLGNNVLASSPIDRQYAEKIVMRGRYMWDIENNTGKFDAPLECAQYVDLSWDELPHNAQVCIMYAAAAAVVRQKLSDTVKENKLAKLSSSYYTLLDQEELRTARMTVNQNAQVAAVRAKLRRRS